MKKGPSMGNPNEDSGVRVAICIPTFMRPVGLARLLRSLGQLELSGDWDGTVEIVVVDNDSEGSARDVVRDEGKNLPWPVRYEIEPERGVSHARNRLVSITQECDFIAFIDDDEHVCREWLSALLEVQRETAAEIVLGPVVPDYLEETPEWVISGKFFNWPRYPSGTSLGFGETSTGLYKRTVFDGLSEPFDTSFARTGSEDTFLFMRVLKQGGRIVWSDEAVAYEVIPNTRATREWILRRAYRAANSFTRCEYLMNPTLAVRLKRFAKGAVWMAIGAAGLPFTVPRGKARYVQMLARICKGAGMVMGVIGHRYEEYHQVHGG